MVGTVASLCLVILGASLLAALYRVLVGPSVADRVAATDLLTTCIMAIVVVAIILDGSRVLLPVVLALAVLGFFGTVAFAKYLIGGRVID